MTSPLARDGNITEIPNYSNILHAKHPLAWCSLLPDDSLPPMHPLPSSR
ncbi:hypothetical protein DVU_1159 [Nitratidesulfovibrio vulgaris str. Hildenborough]|uniref:Uncharacterized protein n=1 Tax=Nitratidesulfovibrio vulgaris (strain ATCC 29579 / DSM 644 / CCUG 34227 / NCIMB 8303 / VKM B-1760 / Hildenborough) TaxID=882 RepID=Q72CX4_NITV2|nr:hypothetical protein DVU_1159 [Nitratidesulfovibrio vulgaris str. Hildenborough]